MLMLRSTLVFSLIKGRKTQILIIGRIQKAHREKQHRFELFLYRECVQFFF